jgi:hypothetical protein
VLGKARFNWTPTRDLVRPWPLSIFAWGFAVVAVFAVVAAIVYAHAFTPAPISSAHATSTLRAQPAIAKQPNASTCTACHTMTASMDNNCAGCHQAPGFTATITEAHKKAGLGCTSCHVEHQGTEFRPAVASLETCLSCHNDAKTFNGARMHTPHGGTFGYPVVGGKWKWPGLPKDEWQQKSPEVQEAIRQNEEALKRAPAGTDTEQARRSTEFHTLHMYRVKAPAGFAANSEGEMSCSSCHKSFSPIDRAMPVSTCDKCHNGDPGGKFANVLKSDQPNCISCHVQHTKGRREWGSTLLAGSDARTMTTEQSAISVSNNRRN